MHEPSRNTRGRWLVRAGIVLLALLALASGGAWWGWRSAQPRIRAAVAAAASRATGLHVDIGRIEFEPPRVVRLRDIAADGCGRWAGERTPCLTATIRSVDLEVDPVGLTDQRIEVREVSINGGNLLVGPPHRLVPVVRATTPSPPPVTTSATRGWTVVTDSIRVVTRDIEWSLAPEVAAGTLDIVAQGRINELGATHVRAPTASADDRWLVRASLELPDLGHLEGDAEVGRTGLGPLKATWNRGTHLTATLAARGASWLPGGVRFFGLEGSLQGGQLSGMSVAVAASAPDASVSCEERTGCAARAPAVEARWLPDGARLAIEDIHLSRSAGLMVSELRVRADGQTLGVRATRTWSGDTVRLEADRFPLSRLALSLPADFRPPVDAGTLDGALEVRLTPAGGDVDLALSVEGAGFAWNRISAARVDGLTVGAWGRALWSRSGWQVSNTRIAAGEAQVDLTASGSWPGPAATLELEASMPPVDAARLARSVPPGLAPWLADAEIAGTLGFGVWISANAARPDQTVGQFELYEDGLQLEPKGAAAMPTVVGGKVTGLPDGGDSNWPRPGAPRWIPLRSLPPFVARAVLAAEDDAFYFHGGVDWRGVQRALTQDLAVGGFAAGGSTITQQVAKNLYLSQERSVGRKVQELALTWALEQHVSKDVILEIYLNTAQFGPGMSGIEAAAQGYFGKAATALTQAEAVVLGAILPSPGRFGQQYAAGRFDAGRVEKMQHIVANLERSRAVSAEVARSIRRRISENRMSDAPLPSRLFDATPSATQK